MSAISIVCFAICIVIALGAFWRGADPLAPARLFSFVWSLAIGLADLKMSALQHDWSVSSWVLLLMGVFSFLAGSLVAFVVNMNSPLLPLSAIRNQLKQTRFHERRLFWFIVAGTFIYAGAYLTNYMTRGWLPIDTIGTSVSRVDFNVSGLTLFLYSITFIVVLIILYFLYIPAKHYKKVLLVGILALVSGSFVILLMRYPIILVATMIFTLLYYATTHLRMRFALPLLAFVVGFFFWVSSLRFSHVVSTYLYSVSKMRFAKNYAILTEPYMYVVTNLENFARAVDKAEYHTFGYFTFDFVTAISGLKYWVLDYFSFERAPYLTSSYNTYTAFWWFYSDFGVFGLALIPGLLGLAIGMLYYRVRKRPTLENVILYSIMVFTILISYFNFPFSFLWFYYSIGVLYFALRLSLVRS